MELVINVNSNERWDEKIFKQLESVDLESITSYKIVTGNATFTAARIAVSVVKALHLVNPKPIYVDDKQVTIEELKPHYATEYRVKHKQ